MLLFIDNYDSFSWNLVRYFRELGVEVVVYANDSADLFTVLSQQPRSFSGICLSPGPKTPKESAGSMKALALAAANAIPLIGVCLGHQCMADYYGARVERAITPIHGKRSTISHTNEGIFKGLKASFEVGRYHSLVVAKDSLHAALAVDAVARDDQSIMAIRHRTLPHFGVQFHPESILSQEGHALLQNFVAIL